MNQLVRAVAPDVNRASVYRCIALFESLGVVQRIQIGWKYKLELSNDFQDHHHHLVCTECGSISSFHEPSGFDAMLERIANLQAFEITAHQLELRGVCKSCQKTSEHLT